MDSDKPKLLSYLRARDILILATADVKPRACSVYYGIAQDFSMYILTPPDSEHGKMIAGNPSVAGVVVDTTQRHFENLKRIGVQIEATATQLQDEKEMEDALRIWSKGREDIVQMYMKNIQQNIWKSRPYRIQPIKMKWFNEELYGEEGVKEFEFTSTETN